MSTELRVEIFGAIVAFVICDLFGITVGLITLGIAALIIYGFKL